MMEQEIRKIFSGVEPEKVEKAYKQAAKDVGEAKVTTYQETNDGEYNAVALPDIPHEGFIEIKDQAKGKVTGKIVHQQVIADRRLKPPVTVNYVRQADYEQWRARIIERTRRYLGA